MDECFGIYAQLYEACIAYRTDSALRLLTDKEALLRTLTGERYCYDVDFNRINVRIIIGMFKEARGYSGVDFGRGTVGIGGSEKYLLAVAYCMGV